MLNLWTSQNSTGYTCSFQSFSDSPKGRLVIVKTVGKFGLERISKYLTLPPAQSSINREDKPGWSVIYPVEFWKIPRMLSWKHDHSGQHILLFVQPHSENVSPYSVLMHFISIILIYYLFYSCYCSSFQESLWKAWLWPLDNLSVGKELVVGLLFFTLHD